MNDPKQILNKIGIDLDGFKSKDGSYVVIIPDSDEYGRIYSKLERWPEIEEDEDTSITTHEMSSIQFHPTRDIETKDEKLEEDDDKPKKFKDAFNLTLIANLDDDEYRLVVN